MLFASYGVAFKSGPMINVAPHEHITGFCKLSIERAYSAALPGFIPGFIPARGVANDILATPL